MAAAAAGIQEPVELKFRLIDGSDIGPLKFGPAVTVQSIKESILSQWPPDKTQAPKSVSDMKLINGGKVLENNRTLAESRVPIGEVPGGVITMHVVVRLSTGERPNEKQDSSDMPRSRCGGCCVL